MKTIGKFFLILLILVVGIGVASPAMAWVWFVNCNAGETITRVLRRTRPGDRIFVWGTCNEAVTISKDRLKLNGLNITTIKGGGQDVITIDGARGVVITGVTVQNGNKGIIGIRGAAFEVRDTTVQDCADDGIGVFHNSDITFYGNIVSRRNRGEGISIGGNSNAEIAGTVLLENNTDSGVIVNMSSSMRISDTAEVTITGTTGEEDGNGIMVLHSSALSTGKGSLIVENNVDGIKVLRESHVRVRNAQIQNNSRRGVIILQHASGRFSEGVYILSNGEDGIRVADNSYLYASKVVVKDNEGLGISADDGSSANIKGSTITGNLEGEVELSFGSRSWLRRNTYDPTPPRITCDNTVLSRGDTVCP